MKNKLSSWNEYLAKSTAHKINPSKVKSIARCIQYVAENRHSASDERNKAQCLLNQINRNTTPLIDDSERIAIIDLFKLSIKTAQETPEEKHYNLTPRQVSSVGRLLTRILRHAPQAANTSLDTNGWCKVDELLAGLSCKGKTPVTMISIAEVVERDSEKRFQLSKDKTMIRCLQGHSAEGVNIQYQEVVPDKTIYHGTSQHGYDEIMKTGGICKMGRTYVCLTDNIEKAKYSGKRHGELVLLEINVMELINNGYKIYKAENGVLLCSFVPKKYIRKVDN